MTTSDVLDNDDIDLDKMIRGRARASGFSEQAIDQMFRCRPGTPTSQSASVAAEELRLKILAQSF